MSEKRDGAIFMDGENSGERPQIYIPLLERMRHGDAESEDRLIQEILRFINGNVRNNVTEDQLSGGVSREDVVQDVFIKVWMALPRFISKGDGHFISWLKTIVKNCIIDSVRKRRSQKGDVEGRALINQTHSTDDRLIDLSIINSAPDPHYVDTSNNVIAHEEHEQLVAAIKSLSPMQKKVSFCFYVLDLSYEEIAKKYTISEGTVKIHLNRARRHILAYFKEQNWI